MPDLFQASTSFFGAAAKTWMPAQTSLRSPRKLDCALPYEHAPRGARAHAVRLLRHDEPRGHGARIKSRVIKRPGVARLCPPYGLGRSSRRSGELRLADEGGFETRPYNLDATGYGRGADTRVQLCRSPAFFWTHSIHGVSPACNRLGAPFGVYERRAAGEPFSVWRPTGGSG
jgi:hypothetical protein